MLQPSCAGLSTESQSGVWWMGNNAESFNWASLLGGVFVSGGLMFLALFAKKNPNASASTASRLVRIPHLAGRVEGFLGPYEEVEFMIVYLSALVRLLRPIYFQAKRPTV